MTCSYAMHWMYRDCCWLVVHWVSTYVTIGQVIHLYTSSWLKSHLNSGTCHSGKKQIHLFKAYKFIHHDEAMFCILGAVSRGRGLWRSASVWSNLVRSRTSSLHSHPSSEALQTKPCISRLQWCTVFICKSYFTVKLFLTSFHVYWSGLVNPG